MMPGMGGPGPQRPQMLVLNKNTKRETGKKAQKSNIQAAVNVAAILRTTLGPSSMLKMLLDPMGGIVLTNDGNAILREVDVGHPCAKNLIELSRAQDEAVGDGTTSVNVLCGEMLSVAEPLLDIMHPTVIVQGYLKALKDALTFLEEIAIPIDITTKSSIIEVVQSSIDTKFVSRWGTMISTLAVDAALCVFEENSQTGKKEIDLKRYAKVEKISGGDLEESTVLRGVMFNKDITHPKMRRKIKNPRIVLLDCPLEYKKGESQTNVEITKESDWELMLKMEEDDVKRVCDEIIRVKPDLVITEKGISDLAQHFLLKHNISCIRRIRKTDNNRIARVSGATIVNRVEELSEEVVGTQCKNFEIKKLGEEYFTYLTECENPKACSVVLRGASRDVLNEIERNLHDAWNVARNIILEPKMLPGGGSCEMYLACKMKMKSAEIFSGTNKDKTDNLDILRNGNVRSNNIHSIKPVYEAVASAFEVIPRTLVQNSGSSVIRTITSLRSKMNSAILNNEKIVLGVDGITGEVVNVVEKGMNSGLLDTYATKAQVFKSAIETAAMILRIDDIVSGQKSGGSARPGSYAKEGNPNEALEGEGDQV